MKLSGSQGSMAQAQADWAGAISTWEPDVFNDTARNGAGSSSSYRVLQDNLLKSLSYQTMEGRQSSIADASQETFMWIFEQTTASTTPDNVGAPKFIDWLKGTPQTEKDLIYWITGKPGSGKSTLMKFICGHQLLNQNLQVWSGEQPLITAHFYFWNAGTNDQKSQDGLMRSLLFQCLSQMPSLVPLVCPKRWALLKLFGTTAEFPDWTRKEIDDAMSRVAAQHAKPANIALFIDGLDEFDGDHEALVPQLQGLVTTYNLKLCVSSRPWNVFRDAFGAHPSLTMGALTKRDISTFVSSSFDQSPAFQEMKEVYPNETQAMKDQILEKTQGVFLWVSLVLRSLLRGLREGDQLLTLQTKIDELPDDLEKLFQRSGTRSSPNTSLTPRSSSSSLGVRGLLYALRPKFSG